MKGFYGKLLRIDLKMRQWAEEVISPDILRRFLGGKGLGSYLLLNNVKSNTGALDPDNKIIFTVGPATGSGFPGSGRFGVFAKSPLTGGYAESYAGGKAAEAIKSTGFDAIVIEGQSLEPISLEVSDGGVVFRDAKHLWGKDAIVTEDTLLKEVGVRGAQAVVIGAAGENLVAFACLQSNYWRSAGRGGLGAVLGSKGVKGIVFHGQTKCQVADESGLKQLIVDLCRGASNNPGVKFYRNYGTPGMVALLNKAGVFPSRYWSEGTLPGWETISGDFLLENYNVQPRSCCRCILACGKLVTIVDGPRKGLRLEGPEYETIYAFGGLCCITNMDEIIYLNDLCDRLGLDTITGGNLVALAMEAVRLGRTGIKIGYGDADGAARLLEEMAYRKGEGAIFSNGIIKAADTLNMSKEAIHVKGMEPAGYDPRILKGVGLGYATSARGACHLRATFYKPELSGVIEPTVTQGKAELYVEYENRLTIFNTLILCVFYRDLMPWEQLKQLLLALTGHDFQVSELKQTANDIITLTRLFNLSNGLNHHQDTLPERFFKENLGEKGITGEELNYMVQEYYRLRDWDSLGVP